MCAGIATALAAQDTQENQAPLSVIDWLGGQEENLLNTTPRRRDEPPVTQTGAVPEVTVTPLTGSSPRQIGLVPTDVTGLPSTLWQGSPPSRLVRLITTLPDMRLPAAQSLLYKMLLSDALAPGQQAVAGDALALARVSKLMELGALEPAMSLIEESGVSTSPEHFDLWMQISLLTGTKDRACAMLKRSPHLTRDYGVRILCAARGGAWDNASLTFGSAQALGLMAEEKLILFDRFLHPEAFEEAKPLPVPQPRDVDPLTFRLFETIGEPLPTRALPRPFAVADLRDVAGWKAQLEAAERLSRAGALPHNQYLGTLTDRRPAASGGIWDRVAAIQRFETALTTGSAEAVRKTIFAAWDAARAAQIEVTFATLFSPALRDIPLEGETADLALKIALLSPAYQEIAPEISPPTLLTRIALGQPPVERPDDALGNAIYEAFIGTPPRPEFMTMAAKDRLGEVLLELIAMLQNGAAGDPAALRDALSTLRALGFEDTARQAALQILILDL
jgi:hypothetical protein